jgi:ATP-dependent helicase/nuclease subunit B
VQGWLEIYHETGRHLVLCGMNEGRVPSRSGGEPWLSEAVREKLGLVRDADRAARDAFLYQSMLEARRDGGRVDVICGKSGAGGEPLLPSRVLLAAERDELPGRVKSLFKEVEPPEAGMRWHADWKWTPRRVEPPKRLGVTSLGDYLACPFRYYLKHVLEMRSPEPNRTEWNARDFGTAAHEVLERWGRDPEARSLEKEEAIQAWLSAALDRVVAEWFGKRIPLAVRIQTESLRQRLSWFSRVQAAACQQGWEVVDVERKVELPVGDALIVAKIDRIDRHRETGSLKVLDYKTGRVDGVDKAHRRKLTAAAALPSHLSRDCPAVFIREEKGKSTEFLWQNLQLPLYAAALVDRGEPLPTPCYFTLRSTEADVGIHEWLDFDTADLDAAMSCANWIVGQIADGVFGPPAERVPYDDFSVLAAGRELGEMTHFQSKADRAE